MLNEPFISGDSIIHQLDPRYKIIFTIIFSCSVALSNNFTALTAALLTALGLVYCAQLKPAAVLHRLGTLMGFTIMIWIFLPLYSQGDIWWQVGPLSFTREGIFLAGRITLKAIIILMIFMSLAATMSIATLAAGLDRLKVSNKLIFLLIITYRYIFVLKQEYQCLQRAIKVRGFRPGTNLHSYKTYAYLIGMLLVRAALRGDQVQKAMRCRGFNGKFHSLCDFKTQPRDLIFSLMMSLTIGGLILLEFLYR